MLGRPSKPPVQSWPRLAASSSSAMVQSVSISSVSPVVRSSTRPGGKPDQRRHRPPPAIRLVIGSFQMP